MLPTNVVSFMKKMVKNPESGQDNAAAANKLSRLKQTLTTGLQQAHESVIKFSPKKHITAGVDIARRIQSRDFGHLATTESSSSVCNLTTIPINDEETLVPSTSSSPSGNKNSPGPLDRTTSCRVCVRSLSGSDVTYRLCSQCNLKVCEDCASYSNLDKDIDQTFWRCSVCRRRSQDVGRSPTPTISTTISRHGLAHRWSEDKPYSEDNSRSDPNSKSERNGCSKPTSVPVSRRERRSDAGSEDLFLSTSAKSLLISQQKHVHSVEDLHHSQKNRSRSNCDIKKMVHPLKHPPCLLSSTSASASESSLEETEFIRENRSEEHRRPSQAPREQTYLSAGDACLSQWRQRRYSSESSDTSDASSISAQRRQDSRDENPTSSSSLLPSTSTRRRLSFRNRRSRHFCDAEVSDGYDADEQSVGTFDSSPSPVSCDVSTLEAHLSSPRRSCDTFNDLINSGQNKQGTLRSPRNPLFNGADDVDNKKRKISAQLSDPPCNVSRSQSPRLSQGNPDTRFRDGDRRSAEREAIRIIIDDVDSDRVKETSSIYVTRLRRDPSKTGQGFAGFGLTLTGGRVGPDGRLYAVITRVEPNGIADRAGLRCGDFVLCWDGIQLTGRSFEEVQEELEHSGDCIEIQVQRGTDGEDGRRSSCKYASPLLYDSSGRATPPSPTRRRLPQAPGGSKNPHQDPSLYRVQLKINYNSRDSLSVTVLCAEKVHDDPSSQEDSLLWIQLNLILPNGACRKFLTDRVEPVYGLRWNSVFTCSDMTVDDVHRSKLHISIWEDSFKKRENKLAETSLELDPVTLDGRSLWLPLKQCDGIYSSPTLSPTLSRRLSKAFSHEHHLEDSVDNSESSSVSYQIPRSRSAESNLLLQPEIPWNNSGLSAPASLAPSRRGSSHNSPDLPFPHSTPSSRRGSSVFVDPSEVIQMSEMVQQKLSLNSHVESSNRRSQSFRMSRSPVPTEMCRSHRQEHSHDRIINTSSLELGPGQIPPTEFIPTSVSLGQIKMGLILSKGQLEVEVIAARNLPLEDTNAFPDTFVKVSLSNDGRIVSKRKTRIMRQTCHPQFHQTLVFEACNALGGILITTLYLKQGGRSLRKGSCVGSGKNQPLGVAHISLDRLPLTTLTIAWYRLIPLYLTSLQEDFQSDESV